jgi:hypothetical protein
MNPDTLGREERKQGSEAERTSSRVVDENVSSDVDRIKVTMMPRDLVGVFVLCEELDTLDSTDCSMSLALCSANLSTFVTVAAVVASVALSVTALCVFVSVMFASAMATAYFASRVRVAVRVRKKTVARLAARRPFLERHDD